VLSFDYTSQKPIQAELQQYTDNNDRQQQGKNQRQGTYDPFPSQTTKVHNPAS
jgi:hypothetical protein